MLLGLKKYFVTFVIFALCYLPAGARVVRLDETDLGGQHYKYLYQWYDPDVKPKAVIIAVHGLTMHGLVFNGLANHLVNEGMLVLAPDLPGYGRRYVSNNAISYSQAINEIADIIKAVQVSYKNLPIVCLGESLGSNLVLYAAQNKSISVEGLILASPALKPRLHINPRLVKDDVNMLIGLIDANATLNLSPYIKAYSSEDPTITKAVLDDPLVRKQLSCQDIWHSYVFMQPVLKKASLINSSTAILIMQGSKDRVLKSNAIIKLVSNLKTNDLTVKWFKDQGHLMLETPNPQIDILQTIDEWLKSHINEPLLQARSVTPTRAQIQTALPSVGERIIDATATIK